MTSTQRGISRALVVLALSGAGTGIVGAVSVSAHADGLPNPSPLPTTDPLSLPGGVTDPLPLPGSTDSPAPQPSDPSTTDGGTANTGSAPADTSSTGTSAAQTDAGQPAAGKAAPSEVTGNTTATSKSAAQQPATSSGVAKSAPVTSTKVSSPTNLNLAKTAGGLTQGAVAPKVPAPNVGVPAPMRPLQHALSLPDLPALPGLVGSSLSAGVDPQAPIVAAAPVTSGTAAVAAAGNASAEPYIRTSSATPTGRRSPVAPALFALVAAAVAAGVAKVRIRWGRR